MTVTVITGGQYGSEGKGKIAAHLATTRPISHSVRCGGPNSGHTVQHASHTWKLRQIPAAFVNPDTRLLLPAGALVDPDIFLQETQTCRLNPDRVGIDRQATVIEPRDTDEEHHLDLQSRLGSTQSGTGAALVRRLLRQPDFRQAQDHPDLRPYTTDVSMELHQALQDPNSNILIEGTQGFGLSLYHGDEWPYRTARDTTAHAFLSETGLGCRHFDVILALRTHPIRVGGNSGPLPNEIDWPSLTRRCGAPHPLMEHTTATGRPRRVALLDTDLAVRAVRANQPTSIALHGVDYLDHANHQARALDQLTTSTRTFIQNLERATRTPVTLIGTGPALEDIIDLT